jgi:competence ComEA-like helix-hairpin-helix protein
VSLYSRRQAALLLALVVAGGVGVGIGHWRRGHPDLVGTLEGFDHTARPALVRPEPRESARQGRAAVPLGTRVAKPGGGRAPEEDRPAAIDLNGASVGEMTRLPGIGPVLAGRIVASREATGPFTSVDELRRVPGIGPTKLERLRGHVTVAP